MPTAGKATLSVYRLSGQLLTRFVRGFVEPGIHGIVWKTAAVPSGIYMVRLQYGNQTVTRPVMLRK
jgi:hypothetical protein